MIKNITTSLLFVLLFSGCSGENAYDGTGLIGGNPSAADSTVFTSMQENIFLPDAQALQVKLDEINSVVDQKVSEAQLTTLQNGFESFMMSWKSVQATYIAGDFNSSLIDIPDFIDHFHIGKSLDIPGDVDRILDNNHSLELVSKNSSTGILALEYLLFGKRAQSTEILNRLNGNEQRGVGLLKVIVANLKTKLSVISEFYADETVLSADIEESANQLVNTLVTSAYRVREWRIGEAAGLVTKYQDDPDPERLEYYNSGLSLKAIESIVDAHDRIMGAQTYENFGSFASENGAKNVVDDIRTQIQKAQALISNMQGDISSRITTVAVEKEVEELYTELTTLQNLYFSALIQALHLTAEIIEADGD